MQLKHVDTWSKDKCIEWMKIYDEIPDKVKTIDDIRESIKGIVIKDVPYLLDNSLFTSEAEKIRNAVKMLVKMTDGALVLLVDINTSVYLLPFVLGDGMVKYQVSNDIVDRTNSRDFFHLKDAVKEFNQIVKNGWSPDSDTKS